MTGSKEDVYSIQEAVLNMLGDKAEYWEDQWDGKCIYRFEGLANLLEQSMLKDVQKIESSYLIVFMGFECVNPFNHADIFEARFPRKAFFKWWVENPNGLPQPSWFDDLNLDFRPSWIDELGLDKEEKPPLVRDDVPTNEGDIEIVEGLTVKDLRDMLDPHKKTYCPRLLAAIKTKKDLMPRETTTLKIETVYGRYAKDESKRYLKLLGVVNTKDKSKNPDPADLDQKAVARILCRVCKKDEGRPENY